MKRICSNREVVLGVTGSIAAYKACDIASKLVAQGCRVTPVMTASATELLAPASLEAITGSPVITQMFAPLQNREVEHIAVATRAHLFLVAPATANILAKAANGIADDWLSTTLLATRAPILFAPAMNTNMYTHPATQANIEVLCERGCHFVGPAEGRLACGTEGLGRMIDPMAIIEAALPLMSERDDLAGRHVLITSGPTHEPIDPVRFVGNRSSGKMGRALAVEALARGAKVTVVSGPADTALPYGAEVIQVQTATEMHGAVLEHAERADVIIGAAAVADYRVEAPASSKHKRGKGALGLTLAENPDIIADIAARKKPGQIIVGFAAETDNVVEQARVKLAKKHLDINVANEVGSTDSGFGVDTSRATILMADGDDCDLGLVSKDELAEQIFDVISERVSRS